MITTLAIATMTGAFVCPFVTTPNWADFTSPEQWNREYSEFKQEEMIPIPVYNIKELVVPMKQLQKAKKTNLLKMTAKLFYATRFKGSYNVDLGENTGDHKGVDMKQPLNTPIRAIGNGSVVRVWNDRNTGLTVTIRHGDGVTSLYGHMAKANVKKGQRVKAADIIGTVGITGKTTSPHLHIETMKFGVLVNPMNIIPSPCK